jgi:hypothetical protein
VAIFNCPEVVHKFSHFRQKTAVENTPQEFP